MGAASNIINAAITAGLKTAGVPSTKTKQTGDALLKQKTAGDVLLKNSTSPLR